MFIYLRGGIGVDYQRQLIALAPFIALAWWARRRGRAPSRSHDIVDRTPLKKSAPTA
jgi:hypothetical protein